MKRLAIQSCASMLVLAVASMAAPAFAQTAPAAGDNGGGDSLSEIVVTATPGNRSKLDTSVSISSVDSSIVKDFHPMSEGDMLRLLPGLQPNISGPGGNGNFAVRGLPVATGGATFVQLQEDGLPTVLYGDMQFGNNDYWTKSSPTDERIEAIRGGTAATLASQAPGAVINYISKTSRSEGGYIQLEKNLTYDYTKASFLYSGIVNDSTYYNIGGYYDVGHGPWHTGYNLSNSYLIKGNITKEFADNKGYFRLLFKAQDTREPNTQGGLICGNLSGGQVSNLSTCPGFDARKASNFSVYNTNVNYISYDSGGYAQQPLDGITTKGQSIQAQLHYKFDNGLTVDNNARYSSLSGGFASNFLSVGALNNTAAIPTSGTVGGTTYTFASGLNACTIGSDAQYKAFLAAGGKGYNANGLIGSCVNGSVVNRAVYTSGPNKGQNVAQAYYDNNVEVYTRIRDVGSFANDLKLSWNGDVSGIKTSLTGGWFYMNQKIAMDWHPNQFNSSITPSSSPIDLLDSAGNLLSANGFTGYNNNWGGCCARTYDYSFTDNAAYADLILDVAKFELDASIRHDINHGSGSGTNANDASGNPVTHTYVQSAVNPVTGVAQNVSIPYFVPDGATEVLNYTVPLTSWSVGASYKATDNLNLFLRASKGTRFNSDRMSFSGYFNADGTLDTAGKAAAADYVYQYEIGLKNRGYIGDARYNVELTVYHSHFNITTYELSQTVCPIVTGSPTTYTCIVADKYKTTGAEFYGTVTWGGLNLLANLTYNKAKKQPSGANTVYARSNNIPDLSYTMAVSYDVNKYLSLGTDITGVTSTVDSAGNQWPGATVVGANIKINPVQNFQIGISAYNLFNKLTPLGPGGTDFSTGGGNFVGSASTVLGRSFLASAKFSF